MASILQVSIGTVNRDLSYLRQQAKSNIRRYIDERLPEEYEKCLVGLTAILREAWSTSQQTEDRREKIQALSLAKECYSMILNRIITDANLIYYYLLISWDRQSTVFQIIMHAQILSNNGKVNFLYWITRLLFIMLLARTESSSTTSTISTFAYFEKRIKILPAFSGGVLYAYLHHIRYCFEWRYCKY